MKSIFNRRRPRRLRPSFQTSLVGTLGKTRGNGNENITKQKV